MDSRVEPTLDFLSPEFDAERALRSDISELQLPYPKVKPCDNLQAYESLVSGTKRHNEPADVTRLQAETPLGAERTAPLRHRKQMKTVVNMMEGEQKSGPLALLQRWWREQVTVRVWIRHSAGIRGTCRGKVAAFDKHFNMVLTDVFEDYTPFRSVENGGKVPGRRKKKSDPATSTENGQAGPSRELHRSCSQLFVRGDNVVLVAASSN